MPRLGIGVGLGPQRPVGDAGPPSPPSGYNWLLFVNDSGAYTRLLYKDADGVFRPLAYKVA